MSKLVAVLILLKKSRKKNNKEMQGTMPIKNGGRLFVPELWLSRQRDVTP